MQIALLVVMTATIVVVAPQFEGFTLASVVCSKPGLVFGCRTG